MAREFWSSPRIQIQSICTGLTHIKPRVWSPDKMVESKRSNLKKQMRKLKSQIIYSFVRVDTVLNSNKAHSGGDLAQNLSALQSQQGFPCLICADLMPVFYWPSYSDLKTHTHSHRHRETPPLITVCWEQCTWHLQIYSTLLFCFQPEVANSTSIRKSTFYSLDTDNCEDTATYLWARCFQACLNTCVRNLSVRAFLSAQCPVSAHTISLK